MGLLGKTARKFKRAIGLSKAMTISEADQKLLNTIRECVETDLDATDEQRPRELDDLRYCDPETQWTDDERSSRESSGRPVLTEDRLGPFLTQVCNEQRKNKPGVQVNPVDDSGDVDTAEVIQGLIRHIEYSSNADTAYDTAFESAVRCGRGFYRICTDYVGEEGFEQEILIKRVPNVHNVYIDPAAEEADYSDAKWGGFKTWMSQDDFEAQYPKSQLANIGTDSWQSIGDDAPDWMTEDGSACLVVEHYYKEFTPTKRYLLKDGTVADKVPAGQTPKDTRDAIKVTVKWVKATAVEILERGEWPSKYIPIVPVLGKELIVNGKRTYAGLVRPAKDPQKRHNYLLTSQVERIAFMPLATWIGAKGFMGKEKKSWASAHKQQLAALEYEIVGDEGDKINAPRLITEEAPIRAVTEAMVGAEQGMKAVLGMYDPSLGNREANQSGIAIGRLQQQGETGNFHFQDNLSRALRYEGRIILDLIPVIYDTERVIRIVGEDGHQETVRVNGQPQEPDETLDDQKKAVAKIFDLTTGKYDVTVAAGPSYQSKRQEDRALLMAMLTGPMGQVIGTAAPDLVASTLDSPIAKKLTDRLKKTLPPALQDNPPQQPSIPPQLQQQMQALMQQHEQLTQALHAAQDQIEQQQAKVNGELAKAHLDAETKLRIAQMNNETALLQTEAQINAQAAQDGIIAQIQNLESLVLAMHEGVAPLIAPATTAGTETENAGEPAGMEAP